MEKRSSRMTWALGTGVLIIVSGVLAMPFLLRTNYDVVSNTEISVSATTSEEVVTHVEAPESVRAIYMTACVLGTPTWRESLKKLIEETELNAVVLDIKDYTGVVSYPNDYPTAGQGKGCVVSDTKEFIKSLHAAEIYVIGRISVFQDPLYTKLFPELAVRSKSTGGTWYDRKGLAFIDVGAKQYWDYIVEMAKDSYALGYDEINFDYIRYPSDGDMKDAHYTYMSASSTKAEMLESFFSYLYNSLKDTGVKTSADLFGLVTVAYDDLGIGQELVRALPYFDYIAPMVYPSHFAPGTAGYQNPAAHPYEIIKYSMSTARTREMNIYGTTTPSRLRPWLQDFDLGHTYDVKEVRAQIDATYDSGAGSWMIWDPANRYSRGAFKPAENLGVEP